TKIRFSVQTLYIRLLWTYFPIIVPPRDALSITATVGEYDSTIEEGTEQVFEVSVPDGVSQHPGFSFQNQTNDISILTLSTPIDMSRICAKPVCLNPTYQLTSGQQCKIAGWGRLN
ncbi:serine protease 56, partial [Biomphalaria glabrata]